MKIKIRQSKYRGLEFGGSAFDEGKEKGKVYDIDCSNKETDGNIVSFSHSSNGYNVKGTACTEIIEVGTDK
tara:strand:+ start:596 stop:808 length:213 start_codon:yes stop_codon:yes gene_type:complete